MRGACGSVESNDIEASSGSRRWTFQPATRNGQPITADVVVPIEFRAQ